MDPVAKLPPEITFEIFCYLDPETLLTASAASRAWRDRIFDLRLWKILFLREGWRVDEEAIRNFEQEYSEPARKVRTRHADTEAGDRMFKKRAPPARGIWRTTRSRRVHAAVQAVEHTFADSEGDHHMSDASELVPSPRQRLSPTSRRRESRLEYTLKPTGQPASLAKSSILTRIPNGTVRLNWQHLYKQRRRLEENWLNARCTNLQLPHPAHLEEAHRECVYAIQFSGKWLVSGSRDQTVRVWDLETRRLRYPPLRGHTKSVLCLQFDPSPSEDLIVSGSGDKSVKIWRFSTGRLVHELNPAHNDSVLNLKYDNRYLVTCSKDARIRIWNRQQLCPSDSNYPSVHRDNGVLYPSYIIDTTDISPSILEAELANGHARKLEPYSLLMTLEGHAAAVNAIQITDDEIVSASGDKLIKTWDIRSGTCKMTTVGHKSGIACVQLDGRRIISGSSDESVRIFDHESGAELACLKGHSKLVRAVQADFADPPGADEVMRLEAQAAEERFEASMEDELERMSTSAVRNASIARASEEAEDVPFIKGTKIPAGGGGGRWAKVLSGSYDNNVIIWRKNREGQWVISQRLHQGEAVARASQAAGASSRQRPPVQTLNNHTTLMNARAQLAGQPFHIQLANPAPDPNAPQNANLQAANPATAHAPGPAAPANADVNANPDPQAAEPQAQVQIQGHPLLTPAHAQHLAALNASPPSEFRVFKLQFDPRKLICSTQDPRIVAWDFACGDEEIIEACQFFW